MVKKYIKILSAGICLIAFLCIGFFYLPLNKISAAGLEAPYPVIAGQTLTPETKLPEYILYLFNAGMSIGFFAVLIALVIAGVMFVLSPAKPDLLADAKDRVSGAITGLLILTMTYLIITTINPQLSFFHSDKLPDAPQQEVKISNPGVYFYKSGCSDISAKPNTSSLSDLGSALRNQVRAVKIVQSPEVSYISILYQNPGFWGKCQYINPNDGCQTVQNFATSASIYAYSATSDNSATGVYFYRKSFFDKSGGYFKVSKDEIDNSGSAFYNRDLNQLTFTGVPDEEQDCVKYNADGSCAKDSRRPPSLSGENISSVKIDGNYLVLFYYKDQKDPAYGPWTSCQEFPTPFDINKTGPQQMKWQNIRNSNGVVPNSVMIMTIQK